MKNILFIIDKFGLGGAENLLLDVCTEMKDRGLAPFVITMFTGGELREAFESLGIKVFCINRRRPLDILAIYKIIIFIKTNKVEIVHTHLFTAGLHGRIAALLSGVKFIYHTVHAYTTITNKKLAYTEYLLSFLTRRVIAVSSDVKTRLIKEQHLSEKIIFILHNAINFSKLESKQPINYRYKLDIPPESFVFGMIARFCPISKDYITLVHAIPFVSNIIPNAIFLLVGDGPQLMNIRKLCDELNIKDKVIFTGFRKDIGNVLDNIDIFVLSSKAESFGIVLLEAMYKGKPLIATDLPAIREVVPEEFHHLLVPPSNVHALANTLLKVASDTNLQSRLSKTGHRHVLKFSIKSYVDNLLKIYGGIENFNA